jgi:hypothetical protein
MIGENLCVASRLSGDERTERVGTNRNFSVDCSEFNDLQVNPLGWAALVILAG